MFIRTITISTNPATQMSLCYQNEASCKKAWEDFTIPGREDAVVSISDDFGTVFKFRINLYACDSVIDNMQSNFVKANQKIDEINAAQMFAEYLKENPALKSMLDAYENRQRMAQQPPPQFNRGGKGKR